VSAERAHETDEAIQGHADQEIQGQPQIDLKHAVTERVRQLRFNREIDYISAEDREQILGPAARRGDSS